VPAITVIGGGMAGSGEQLRAIVGESASLVKAKLTYRLNAFTAQFVERSPFACVATGRLNGGFDISPRGDPRIALLFLIPGIGDTFRVNGTPAITDDEALLAKCAVNGKAPRLGIVLSVREAYNQCARALIRSDLWNPKRHVERGELPSTGEILKALARVMNKFDLT
jgi:uncharacterized protein